MIFEREEEAFDDPVLLEEERAITARIPEMENRIIETAGYLNVLEYQFIKLLGEFDQHECWAGDGIKSFAHWLNWKCGISPVVAREKVRVARALPDLPLIDEAFRTGRISYSKVRAVTRAATPDNEEILLEMAVSTTAAHLEQTTARYRRTQVRGEAPTEWVEYLQPRFSCRQDDHGMYHIYVKLPAEDGALVEKAVTRMVNKMRADSSADDHGQLHDGKYPDELIDDREATALETKECGSQPKKVSAETYFREAGRAFACQRVTALARIAEHYLALPPGGDEKQLRGADKYHVILHVNVNDKHRDTAINRGPCCYLEQGGFISPQVVQRLACDASVTTALEDDDGRVLDIGRRSRVIPRQIELAVDIRDNYTCQFPNCHEHRFVEKHHIITWANGGPTSVENLITLCRYHHGQVHEGKFRIVAHGDDFQFYDAQGNRLERGLDPQFPITKPLLPEVQTPPVVTTPAQRERAQISALLDFYRTAGPV